MINIIRRARLALGGHGIKKAEGNRGERHREVKVADPTALLKVVKEWHDIAYRRV